jgi:hypothetical protein
MTLLLLSTVCFLAKKVGVALIPVDRCPALLQVMATLSHLVAANGS